MKKRVLVICTGPRRGGNSETLADALIKGAHEAGHDVDKICLYDKTINFCTGCLACQKSQRCVIHDDADLIASQMQKAEVIVFATPIYYYEMCGQMKTMLDRSNPLFPSDYAFRDIYLLATAADTEPTAMNGAIKGLQGWVDCFNKTSLKGVVRGLGADALGSIAGNPALEEAYQTGLNL